MKSTDKTSESLKRSVTELALLALLADEDMYGYDMGQSLRERSDGDFAIVESTLYPTLYRLEDSGYISSTQKKVGVRRMRTYYHLEPAGREYLKTGMAKYLKFMRGVQKVFESSGIRKELPDV